MFASSPTFAAPATLGLMVLAAAAAGDERPPDFAREIQPILAEHCLACHGAAEQEAGLRLDRADGAATPLPSGRTAIVPGDPQQSELLRRITHADPDLRMPPERPALGDTEIGVLRRWIAAGAPYQQHWAYRPLSAPPPPEQPGGWARNPIDLYVLHELRQRSLEPSPEADRLTLIRRLYLDLLGLPPTPEEADAFAADSRGDAYSRLVDRLLASPAFGERWGRHWLDMARYADSDGYEKDNPRPDAWRYRDWVIRQLNADTPFDRFSLLQLAGDLLENASPLEHLATAFHRQTLTNTEGGVDQEEFRVAAVMDRVETLGVVWLGLTVGCARCHDHKYDALTQENYYQLYAFFNNADETTLEAPLAPGSSSTMKVRVVRQRREAPRATQVLRRGDFQQPGAAVEADVPDLLAASLGGAEATRLELAKWLFDEDNPLAARVAANHVWKHFFGAGLVRTPDDFGVRGEPPTHPELLDWLAAEWFRHGWSRKQLIRTIVLSSTYRQASATRNVEQDPENRWLSRQNRVRVEAEIFRDLALSASGLLSRRVGGPSVFPPIPSGVTDLTYNSSFQWKTSGGADRYRRGMYTFFKRTAPHPNLTTLDCPDSNTAQVARPRSNTPIAALLTLNNEVYVEAARQLAARVLQTSAVASDRERLRFAFRLCLTRPPQEPELDALKELLDRSREWYGRQPAAAAELTSAANDDGDQPPREWANREWAAWTATLRVLLNLDEFYVRD